MKEVREPYIKRYPPLKFFRDDLETIVNIFQKHFKEFEIIADKYELSDLSDIDKIKKQRITRFSIRHHHRYEEGPRLFLIITTGTTSPIFDHHD